KLLVVAGAEMIGVQLPCKVRARAAGCSCCYAACVASMVARRVRAVAARLALDSLAVVFLVWRMLSGKSRRCSVCRVASLVERYDTCMWLLSACCCCAALEAEVHRLVALCFGEVSQNRLLFS
ncbi:hypothetical protein Taro_025449, partial [Colocasia esculenta]|nr:hypothetical protein [Colocasia esculenta]